MMKFILRCLLAALAISATSASAAQQPAAGLLVYASVANYVEVFEFVSITRKNLFDSTVIRPTGQILSCKTENIVAVVNYPPLFISPENAATASDNIKNIESLQQRYPKFKGQLQAVEAKWNTALEAGKQMKLKEPVAQNPSPKAESFSFTSTTGTRYENVQITSIGDESFGVMTESGVARIPFSDLPEDLRGIPESVKSIVRKRNEAVRIAKEAQAQRDKEAQAQRDREVQAQREKGSEAQAQKADLVNFVLGLALFKSAEQGNEEARKIICEAALQGNAVAQNWLGLAYEKGKVVNRDYIEAAKWYRKAAEQGLAVAQVNLGVCYEHGEGVDKDPIEAVEWYRKAVAQGDATAQFRIGTAYADGEGVKQDDLQAVKWVRKAAEQGLAEAQTNLGLYYEHGVGVDKDLAEAVKWFRKAAEQGNADGEGLLGVSYYKGLGVVEDQVEAVKWLLKAAAQGNPGAQKTLGFAYLNGNGVAQDIAEAVKWFRKAAEQGDADAQYFLGRAYLSGKGVAQDENEGMKWLRKSAAQGDTGAQKLLNKILNH